MTNDEIEKILKSIDISDEEQLALIDEELKKDGNKAFLYNPFALLKNKNKEILDKAIKKDFEEQKKAEF